MTRIHALLLWLAAVGTAQAALPQPVAPLANYHRLQFTPEMGAPPSAGMMAQTADSFLWFAGTHGLYRSDGAVFERFEIAGDRGAFDSVRQLVADADGGLWITYVREGVGYLRNGRWIRYGTESGLPENKQVRAIVRAEGRVLAATLAGLFEKRGERWMQSAPMPELRDQAIESALVDGRGQLWIKVHGAAYYRASPDAAWRRVELPQSDSLVTGLVAGAADSVWYWSHAGQQNLCRLHPDPRPACWRVADIVAPAFDPDGTIWWSEPERLFRLRDSGNLDVRDAEAVIKRGEYIEMPGGELGRSSDGSLWVMGAEGVGRFSPPTLVPTETPNGGIAGGSGGEVWLVSYSRGLMRIGDAGAASPPWFEGEDKTIWSRAALAERDGSAYVPLQRPLAASEAVVLERRQALAFSGMRLDRDGNGDFYVCRIAPLSLTRFSRGRAENLALPALDTGAILRGAKRDAQGRLWLGVSRNRAALYRQEGDQWIANGGLDLPRNLALGGYAFDHRNTLWIAAGAEGVVSAADGRWQRFGPRDGLDIGMAGDVFPGNGQVWIAGSQGLALRKDDRFVPVIGIGDEHFAGVTGLVHLPEGDVWMAGTDGVFRIAAAEWKHALSSAHYRVRFLRLDRWDGVSSAIRGPFPSAARSEDGTLWFAMRTGLYRLRPESIAPALPAPRVFLGAIAVDGRRSPLEGTLEIPPGVHRMSVGFMAPGAQRPDRTQFRYRLARDGQWGEWTFLGKQRQIAFDRLDHGRYRLEIGASGRDGDWTGAPARLAFRILPAFHQTWMFYALLALAGAALLAVLYLTRVRRLSARIRGEMDARLRERERIARDLHDTLLQGMQGLLFSFQAIASRLAPQDPVRGRIEAVLDRTEDVLKEGRDRVSQLRDPRASTLDLPDCLQHHARDLAVEKQLLCEVDVPHSPRELQPVAYEELLQVGREAISNAFQHSRGSQVRVTLAYAEEGVRLAVCDDGIGLPVAAAEANGHWGLRGMQERARLAGAQLSLRRGPEGGTEVKMFVPADKAYPAPHRRP